MRNPFYYILILLGILSTACNQEKKHQPKLTIDSNNAMANELKSLHANLDPLKNTFTNKKRADFFEANARQLNTPEGYMNRLKSAFEYMNANENKNANEIIEELLKKLNSSPLKSNIALKNNILGLRAVNAFRTAELENCIENHNEASCILPFNEESYHKITTGSTQAIQDLEEVLNFQQTPSFIWLLNMAYMTLGKYPDEVPKKHLIPLYAKEKQNLIKPFSNVGSLVGVDDNKLSGSSLIDDFNGDGYYDIICSSWSLDDQIFYYVNNGDGSFTESHASAGLAGITGGLNITHTDFNNDGHLDFLILRGAWLSDGLYPNSLMRNNGDGSFTDVTIASGFISRYPTLGAAWGDFNNDGYLDCFITNESFQGSSQNQCELFLNNKNESFTNIAVQVNANFVGTFKGVAVGDIDNDLDQDIYISNLLGKNHLLRNDKSDNEYGFTFTDISQISKTAGFAQSFPCWFFDYDNDGWLDIFSGSFSTRFYNNLTQQCYLEMTGQNFEADRPALYKNNGNQTFDDIAQQAGLNKACFIMGAGYGDMNNDGYDDMYFGTGEPDLKAVIPNRAFLNNAGKGFDEITAQSRLGHLQKGHGISFADLDFDGDQDIYAVMGGAYEGDNFFNALFENPNNENNWIKIKLEGTKSNRPAIGARLELMVSDGNQKRSIHKTISNGSSFGENPFTQEFGYLKNENIIGLKITWPSGKKMTFDNFKGNKYYFINEDIDEMVLKNYKPLVLKKDSHTHHHHH